MSTHIVFLVGVAFLEEFLPVPEVDKDDDNVLEEEAAGDLEEEEEEVFDDVVVAAAVVVATPLSFSPMFGRGEDPEIVSLPLLFGRDEDANAGVVLLLLPLPEEAVLLLVEGRDPVCSLEEGLLDGILSFSI